MRRHEKGSIAFVMLIGMAAILAVLTAVAVYMVINQQGATARDRSHKDALYYAEAALDSAVNASKRVPHISRTEPFLSPEEMLTDYNQAYASIPAAPTVTTRVYDDADVITDTTPAFDQNNNGTVWLEVTATYLNRTRCLRVKVVQTEVTMVTRFPKAAIFSDQNIYLKNGANVYGVNDDGTPYRPGAPGDYLTSIMARGNIQGNSSTTLAAPGGNPQSIGVKVNGSASGLPTGQTGVTRGGVPLLSDYFNMADQANLGFEAEAGKPPKANAGGTSVSPSKFTTANILTIPGAGYNSATKTYTFANDLVVSGNLTLKSGTGGFPAGTTFNFKSLYVNGSLTLNGSTNTHTTALYTSGSFTINGPTGSNTFGSTYVAGDLNLTSGSTALDFETTDYTKPEEPAGPLWIGQCFKQSGRFNDVLGPTWVCGHPGTSDVAVGLTGPSSGANSTFMCPLLATTEKVTTSGGIDFGTLAKPMVLYMQCDNDNLYTNTMDWRSTGTFTGLMAVMEAAFSGQNNTGRPTIVGAIFCIKDITLSGNTSVCYNQAVLENIQSTAITSTTTTTTTVPGSWQEVSPGS